MHHPHQLAPWKHYMILTAESLIAFYLATFCMAMYFSHQGKDWLIPAIAMSLSYVFIIFVCAKRVGQQLPVPTLMLLIPLAPLIALIIVVSMIPLIQFF